MKNNQNFIYSTIILLFANILVKIIGAIFKIPLTNLIGASGMGTFSVAYNIYAIIFSIIAFGIPVAISKMIAESNALNKNSDIPLIIKCAFAIFFTISLILTLLIFIFAEKICIIIANNSAYLSILAISPAFFLITIVSIFRGYYQGLQNMTQTAISQVIEALFKLLVGYFFADYLIQAGYDSYIASAGAIFGVTVGTFLSALYLCIHILFFREKYTSKPISNYKIISKKLISTTIPITFCGILLSLINLVDMLTIMNRLSKIGINEDFANALYGAYNMALTLYSLPQTIIIAISVSIIPILSENFAKNRFDIVNSLFNTMLYISCIIALPCSIGFMTIPKQILEFLYYKRLDDVKLATPILMILGISVVFVSITTITNAFMQSVSKPFLPLKAIFLGVIIKFIVNVITISIPSINILGACIGSASCFMIIAIMNLLSISKLTHYNFKIFFIKPLIASIIMGFILTKISLDSRFEALFQITIGGSIYFLILILIGGLNLKDLEILKKIKER